MIWLATLSMACECLAVVGVPSLSELLERYTHALDSTQSMISTYETRGIGSAYLPPLGMNYRNETICGRGERRTDGKGSLYHQSYQWGYVVGRGRDVPEETARYSLIVTTPDFQYSHNKTTCGQEPNGLVQYQRYQTVGWGKFRDETDAFFLGYLGNDSRIDINLRNARAISVRPEPEDINGSACYVIEADTIYGDYTIWLDSAHGHQPARIEASRSKDDIMGVTANQPPPDKKVEGRDKVVIDNIAFRKVQGIWIPVEGRTRKHIEWPKDRYYVKDETHFEITEILLNPDHDVLKSFADPMQNPNLDPELVNGTRVRLGEDRLRCQWRWGKLFDGSGNVLDIQTGERRAP
jgi:hypothetical protein